ncbi:GNAT family N-acetyltransferase [Paenibacillus guangzhouensis]|uniref:GNAT family N-acetyltransferase n=1 Tax=Paenibacillus guangzhouensis TaxID=1473112 RepID=UPI001266AB70|nr:GNAT family protein [Paenibacillus guangzhouensis]
MDQIKPIINFSGPKVSLGPLSREYVHLYYQWNNNFIINRTTASMRPVTYEEQYEAFEQYSKNNNFIFFTIFDRATLVPIGLTYLSSIADRNAEYSVVIGEADFHGKGYGTEVTQLMLEYAFKILGLHNVMLTVYAYNSAGIRAYEKAGFREYGRRREVKFYQGRLWDQVLMDCLSTEYTDRLVAEFHDDDEDRTPGGQL